jgi:glucose/mannose-6-phosphate isomerase
MGGSGIGGAIASDILSGISEIPIISNSDYSIPGWVSKGTLVLACSYSGNTEETIEAVKSANEKGSTIAVITSGGLLGELARKNNWPMVSMPGGQPPRSQFGRSFICLAWTLKQFGCFSKKMYAELEGTSKSTAETFETLSEQAKFLTDLVEGKSILLYSDTGSGAIATRWRQQLNENSKLLVNTQMFPEMNHNELVGWDSGNESNVAIILRTPEDHKRTKFRMEVCSEIFRELGADVVIIDAEGENQMQRLMYLIQLGDLLSLLLAEKAGICPVDITNIERLKSELSSR